MPFFFDIFFLTLVKLYSDSESVTMSLGLIHYSGTFYHSRCITSTGSLGTFRNEKL